VFLARLSVTPQGDGVAGFHLDNGARLERVNVSADLSPKGLRESFGVMVNYLYDLRAVEANHERFVRGEVVCSSEMAALA
jgi:malonyl-CoA decarboxylase